MSAGWPPSKNRPAEPMRSDRRRTFTKPLTSAISSLPYPTSPITCRAACWSCSSVGIGGLDRRTGPAAAGDDVPAVGLVHPLQRLRHDLRERLLGVERRLEQRPHHVDVGLHGIAGLGCERVDRQRHGGRVGGVHDGDGRRRSGPTSRRTPTWPARWPATGCPPRVSCSSRCRTVCDLPAPVEPVTKTWRFRVPSGTVNVPTWRSCPSRIAPSASPPAAPTSEVTSKLPASSTRSPGTSRRGSPASAASAPAVATNGEVSVAGPGCRRARPRGTARPLTGPQAVRVVAHLDRTDQHRRDLLQLVRGLGAREHPHAPQPGLLERVELGHPAFEALHGELVVAAALHLQLVLQVGDLFLQHLVAALLGDHEPAERPAHQGDERRLEQARSAVARRGRQRRRQPRRAAAPHHPAGVLQPAVTDLLAPRAVGEQQPLLPPRGRRQRPRVGDQLQRRAAAPRHPADDERPAALRGRQHRGQDRDKIPLRRGVTRRRKDRLDSVPRSL